MASQYSSGGILQYFKKGTVVEISSNDQGFRGSLYLGTIIKPPKNESSTVLVEYETLKADQKGKKPLREQMSLVELRPAQPPEKRLVFEFSDEVDAYYNDGWWEGIITRASPEKDVYKVFFRGTREELEFKASQLRLHREWVKGVWVPPFEDSSQVVEFQGNRTPTSAHAVVVVDDNEEVIEHKYNPGDLVEASSNEEGFEGAWFAATLIEKTTAGKYLIEYQKLRNDDETGLLREEVDETYLRPCPPDVGLVDGFECNDEVDALYNDVWWVGVISKVLKNDRFIVYFKKTDERMIFEHSDLRVHQEWRNGKWRIASKVLK